VEEAPLNPSNPSMTFHIPGLAPIESSMFFPSKRQPGPELFGMWSKGSDENQLKEEIDRLCGALDGFER